MKENEVFSRRKVKINFFKLSECCWEYILEVLRDAIFHNAD